MLRWLGMRETKDLTQQASQAADTAIDAIDDLACFLRHRGDKDRRFLDLGPPDNHERRRQINR